MVRHGTLRKRRSGRKVTRKVKSNKNNIRKSIKNIEIRNKWDVNKSPRINLLSLGIDSNPNKTNKKEINIINNINKESFLGFMSLPTNEFNDVNPKRKKMSDYDQEYIINLINKHNYNFKKMAFDITTNYYQYTEQKLIKMFEKYNNLPLDQKISLEITSPAALNAIETNLNSSSISN